MRDHVDSTHAALLEEERNAPNAKRREIAKVRVKILCFFCPIEFNQTRSIVEKM